MRFFEQSIYMFRSHALLPFIWCIISPPCPFLLSILKTHFQEKSVVPAGSSQVILFLAWNETRNQLLTFPNKSITLEQSRPDENSDCALPAYCISHIQNHIHSPSGQNSLDHQVRDSPCPEQTSMYRALNYNITVIITLKMFWLLIYLITNCLSPKGRC